jgi:hypothetical protein
VVVASGNEDVGSEGIISKRDGVNIVFMSLKSEDTCFPFNVVNHKRAVGASSNNFGISCCD